jgi:putative aldouronate transport system permease protein
MAYSSGKRKIFLFINTMLCIIIALTCLAPMLHILALSFSKKEAIISGMVGFLPVGFTWDNYNYVAKDSAFYNAFLVSVIRTVLALAIQLTMTFLAAYPISHLRNRFHARNFYTWFLLIAVLFNGGLIPTYLVVAKTGLVNSIWSLILPGAVPLFYVILMQNFMKTLPEEIKESAAIDGAGQWRILFRIVLPLCQVSIATVSLFIVVDNWNAWYDGMLYINDNHLFPLQTYLRTVVVQVDLSQMSDMNSIAKLVASTGADTAKIFLAMLPVIAVYPFVQKYFVRGIVLGSVKG